MIATQILLLCALLRTSIGFSSPFAEDCTPSQDRRQQTRALQSLALDSISSKFLQLRKSTGFRTRQPLGWILILPPVVWPWAACFFLSGLGFWQLQAMLMVKFRNVCESVYARWSWDIFCSPFLVFFVLNLVTWEDARKGRVIFSQRNSMCWTRIWPQISNKCRYAYWTVDHSTWKKSHFRKSRTWVPYYLISLELGVKPVFLPPLSRLNLLIFWSLIVNLPNKEPLFHKEIGKKKKKVRYT